MQLFTGSIIVDVRNVGTWRRTITNKDLTIETDLASGLDDRSRAAVHKAVERLTEFLGHKPQNLSR
jgi:hypothetical protein